jgi:hypothetical protein
MWREGDLVFVLCSYSRLLPSLIKADLSQIVMTQRQPLKGDGDDIVP